MIYDELQNIRNSKSARLCTVISGPGAGAHALFLEDEAYIREEGFPEGYIPTASAEMKNACVMSGDSRIFSEIPGKARKAVICGAGHVAVEVVKLLHGLGFQTTVIDDRAVFGRAAKEAGADRVLTGDFGEMLPLAEIDENTCFIVMTRGHRFDMECLEYALRRKTAYIGMMSSRGRAAKAIKIMEQAGIPEERLAELHSPIGLSIGAETPAEIAVSTAAEIISLLSGKNTGWIPDEIIRALSDKRKKIMAVIVGRKGSSPRDAGTRMIVFEDGRLAGTLGGGCFESSVVTRALDMMRMGEKNALLVSDLTGMSDPEDGMACGGVIEVFLEAI